MLRKLNSWQAWFIALKRLCARRAANGRHGQILQDYYRAGKAGGIVDTESELESTSVSEGQRLAEEKRE